MIEYGGGPAPLKTGAVTSMRPKDAAQLLEQAHAVLELEAERREVLDEGGAVDELDRGARPVGRGKRLRHEIVVGRRPGGPRVRLVWGRFSLAGSRRKASKSFWVSDGWKRLGIGSTRKKKPSIRYLTETASSLGSMLDVGGALPGGEGQDVLDDGVGSALLPDRARGVGHAHACRSGD